MSGAPVNPVVQMRLCAAPGCNKRYEHPHGGAWPTGIHSAACARRAALARAPAPRPRAPLAHRPSKERARAVSPASPAQRAATRDHACIVDPSHGAGCDPAHVIPRGMLTAGQDDPLAVVPLCRACHTLYDTGALDLLGSLEPHHRDVLAFAVERFGLIPALERITNARWTARPSRLAEGAA